MRLGRLFLIILGGALFFSIDALAYSRDWDQQELATPQIMESVLEVLTQQKKSKNAPLSIDFQIDFAQAVLFYHQGRFSESIQLLDKISKNNFLLDDYVNYFLGLSYLRSNNFSEAEKAFLKVVNSKEAGPRKLSARYRLGEIALASKKTNLALQHFKFLERNAKGAEKYPYVLWNLSKIHMMDKNFYRACIYVRKLYSKYPSHELLVNWNLDLRSIDMDGYKPNCLASLNDQKTRIRNLQYAGDSERAKKEIQALYKRADAETKYYVDMIFARFLVDDGEIDEALKVLLPYYNLKSGDIAYLMLFAKALSRKGDVSVAVASYLKVHNMKPRSNIGREALFQAAFSSYLNQDYDGALERFADYKKKYGGKNGIASHWHIAWIKYLKGDYKGAYTAFNEFSKLRMSRKMKRQFVDTTRINYWKAVSLIKMGQTQVGQKQLEKIAQDPSVGFYSLAAKARLLGLKDEKSRTISSVEENTSVASSKIDFTPLSLMSVGAVQSGDSVQMETEEEIIDEAKETQGETADSAEEGGEGESDTDVGTEEKSSEEEISSEDSLGQGAEEILANLKDPRLQKWFQKAEMLRLLGFQDWSNRELQFIEAKTRNKTYLQMLVDRYEIGNAYYRSSYIAEIYYDSERRKGLQPSNQSWKKAYPLAFDRVVRSAAEDSGVSSSVIWGIMRTESFYRPTVKSGVGALGLMQVMPHTGQRVADLIGDSSFEVNQLLDPQTNVKIGAFYLQRLSKMFNGSLPLMAAAYNAGPHRVYAWLKNFGELPLDEFIEHIPFHQTRGYAKKVVRSYYIYSVLYGDASSKNGTFIKWISEPSGVVFRGAIPTKETWEPL